MSKRVLVIEDDHELGAQVVEHLRRAGFDPVWRTDGRAIAEGERPDVELVVLDLVLPEVHGFEVLKALRTRSEVPVLVLSGRNEPEDKVRALRLGADDYLTKPFHPAELVERARARLRRPALRISNTLRAGPLRIDLAGRAVELDGRPIGLTPVEFELLAALAGKRGATVTRDWLVEHVLDPEREGTPRALDAHVSRLRKKLGRASLIETVWGVGYRLAA